MLPNPSFKRDALKRAHCQTLGFKMNRALLVSIFVGLGLFTTWSTLRLLALVDWSKIAYARHMHCWEIDHCDVSGYFIALYVTALLMPTAIHAIVGWHLGHSHVPLHKAIAAIFVLWAATLAFYAACRIGSGY